MMFPFFLFLILPIHVPRLKKWRWNLKIYIFIWLLKFAIFRRTDFLSQRNLASLIKPYLSSIERTFQVSITFHIGKNWMEIGFNLVTYTLRCIRMKTIKILKCIQRGSVNKMLLIIILLSSKTFESITDKIPKVKSIRLNFVHSLLNMQNMIWNVFRSKIRHCEP